MLPVGRLALARGAALHVQLVLDKAENMGWSP
jgi:hypothetical protein